MLPKRKQLQESITAGEGSNSEKQGRSSTIQERPGKCLTEEQEILSKWAEYCSELYNHESCGVNAVPDCSQLPEEDLQSIFREKVDIAVTSLKREVYQS